MAAALIMVGLVVLAIGLTICLDTDTNGGWDFTFGVIGAYLLSWGITIYAESCKPTAMDVYQNKTTLEITYRNGVPVDSVVVFKEK